ncbi:MAG: hypothetical protein NT001_00435 [Candidatus Woesearchaeota archaeon]|nr:hypothetical protein [Candidatus Woesearchaeota archaeon]
MIEFNEDGSLKLYAHMEKKKKEDEHRMSIGRCIHIKKEMVNFTAPKKCVLHLKLSDAINDNRFIESVHRQFNENSTVPSKLIKINEKEFNVEIGTDFKRCSDCTKLISLLREFVSDNVIEEAGNCFYNNPFGGQNRNFSYEDYFD